MGGELDAGAVAELPQDVADVPLDGAGAEVQLGADLGVRLAGGDELRDLLFAFAEWAGSGSAAAWAKTERARDRACPVGGAAGVHRVERYDRGEDAVAIAAKPGCLQAQSGDVEAGGAMLGRAEEQCGRILVP
ncbi:MAG TPA: hypothetical protein VJN72_02345, partial [Gaiellales bacterium]|nr:hypothetical protein [Gaiellales bacterium]